MSAHLFLVAVWSLIAGLLVPSQASPLLPLPAPTSPSAAESPITREWTVWGASQYALADDGASLWIGGVGSVVQWDKATGNYRRYSTLDGLPHLRVLAIAVDAAGNRWFGGDGGLSRLDKDGNWTRYTATNSGLRRDEVDALAIVGGDTLYAGHPADGSVSRLAPDGTWQWFPNCETAAQADYADIIGRGSSVNALWTVAGAEVWIGAWIYDGTLWRHRPLPSGERITGLVADGNNHVWARNTGDYLFEWNGDAWVRHGASAFSRQVTALAVDQGGKVWAGLSERDIPYSSEGAVVREATGGNSHPLPQYGPVTALLATAEGLWAVGPDWLMTPDFETTTLPDLPRFDHVRDAIVGPKNLLWLTSSPEQWDDRTGAIQMLDDQGTPRLEDDAWLTRGPEPWYTCRRASAFERYGADLWYATYCYSRVSYPPGLIRYRNGTRIEYKPSELTAGEVTDIFALDERRVWFAVVDRGYPRGDYLLGLDDGGTPADLSDDRWQKFPVGPGAEHLTVAVDSLGRLWRGEEGGLYRYDGAAWQHVYDDRAVCDLAPASDGTVYAQVEWRPGEGCETFSDSVVVAQSDGSISAYPDQVDTLVKHSNASVRTATRRNNLWTFSADGALWHIQRGYPGHQLRRVSIEGEVTPYALPMAAQAVQRVEVDRRGRVWVVADGKLWRMEGPPIPSVDLYLPVTAQ